MAASRTRLHELHVVSFAKASLILTTPAVSTKTFTLFLKRAKLNLAPSMVNLIIYPFILDEIRIFCDTSFKQFHITSFIFILCFTFASNIYTF